MMRAALAEIVSVGMACPLGLSSRAALAAIRAGISRFAEVDEFVGPGGPARASMLAQLGAGHSRTERVTLLARHALREAVCGLSSVDPLPCLLALPEADIGPRVDLDVLLGALAEVKTGLGTRLRLDVRSDRIVTAGRAGVFVALERAVAMLAGGEARTVLVGGVDSLVDLETLDALADRDRLLGLTNLDGTIPGEGAAFILLAAPGAPGRRPRVAALATAHEPIPFTRAREQLSASDGLTAVFRKLGAAVEGCVDAVYAATTGEGYFGQEFSHASLRNAALMPEPLRCEAISHALGDIGAAAGAICLVQAVSCEAVEGRALVYASSDGGLIGGCVIRSPERQASLRK